MWKLIAYLRGYRAAYDVEDGRLVIFKDDRHFYTWKDAAWH